MRRTRRTIKEQLIHAVINSSCFTVGKDSYRLTGYYYIYHIVDGSTVYANVHRKHANAVSGVGVCGIITLIENIKLSKAKTGWKRQMRFDSRRVMIDSIRRDRNSGKAEFLMSLKPGLNGQEYASAYTEWYEIFNARNKK
jgi:hypothetical protein